MKGNDVVRPNAAVINAAQWDCSADPLCLAITSFRFGFAQYNAHAPDDDDAARVYADITYRPYRHLIIQWRAPAQTMEGAIAALRMARDANENDDHEMVGPMVQAALSYLERHN